MQDRKGERHEHRQHKEVVARHHGNSAKGAKQAKRGISLEQRKIQLAQHGRGVNAAHEVDRHVQSHGVAQLARADIDIAKDHADCRGVEELIQIAVHKSEDHAREQDRGQVAVDGETVDEQLAEEDLLKDRGKNAHEQQRYPKGRALCHVLQGILGHPSRERANDGVERRAEKAAKIGEPKAEREKREPGGKRDRPFRDLPSWHEAVEQEREGHGHEIHGEHGERKGYPGQIEQTGRPRRDRRGDQRLQDRGEQKDKGHRKDREPDLYAIRAQRALLCRFFWRAVALGIKLSVHAQSPSFPAG